MPGSELICLIVSFSLEELRSVVGMLLVMVGWLRSVVEMLLGMVGWLLDRK